MSTMPRTGQANCDSQAGPQPVRVMENQGGSIHVPHARGQARWGRSGVLVLCAALCLWAGVPLLARADDTGLKVATAIAAAGSWTNCTVAYLNASE